MRTREILVSPTYNIRLFRAALRAAQTPLGTAHGNSPQVQGLWFPPKGPVQTSCFFPVIKEMWFLSSYKALVLRHEQWHLNKWGEADAPAATTSLLFGLTLFINCWSPLLLVRILTGWFPERAYGWEIFAVAIVPVLLFGLIHYLAFFRESVYEENMQWLSDCEGTGDKGLRSMNMLYHAGSYLIFFVLSVFAATRP